MTKTSNTDLAKALKGLSPEDLQKLLGEVGVKTKGSYPAGVEITAFIGKSGASICSTNSRTTQGIDEFVADLQALLPRFLIAKEKKGTLRDGTTGAVLAYDSVFKGRKTEKMKAAEVLAVTKGTKWADPREVVLTAAQQEAVCEPVLNDPAVSDAIVALSKALAKHARVVTRASDADGE